MIIHIPEAKAESISVSDLLRIGRFEQKLNWLDQALKVAIIQRIANERSIEVTELDLKEVIEVWRQRHGLSKPEDITAWLAHHHLSFDDLEYCLTMQVLERKLIESEIQPGIESFFKQNRPNFDAVCIGKIIVNSNNLAKEIISQIVDDGVDFGWLACQYSQSSEMRYNAGYVGWKFRTDLSHEEAIALFGGSEGDIVGPFRRYDSWEVLKIHAIRWASLDEKVAGLIQDQLFCEWTHREMLKHELHQVKEKARSRSQIELPIPT